MDPFPRASAERRLTEGPGGRILSNAGVWSPDGRWIVYDTRSDAAGGVFDGERIEAVEVDTGRRRTIFTAARGARCGAAIFHPRRPEVACILGPEAPSADWSYGPARRRGIAIDFETGETRGIDARDLAPPFTPGALRGGSHVHVFDASGERVAFTYHDALVETDVRDVAVGICGRPVAVGRGHERNRDGGVFSVVVSRTTTAPRPGSDDISRACEEAWVGERGYERPGGARQRWALAFQGIVADARGRAVTEVFIADLPEDLTRPGGGPLEGTTARRPAPPDGVVQRRLTFTAERRFPGLQGPRHWLRSSPDGERIAFLLRDDDGVVQLWTVSPLGGPPRQLTRNASDIASAFTWTPDGRAIAHVLDGSVCLTDAASGETRRLAPPAADPEAAPRPEACVVSPDGRRVAYVRRLAEAGGQANHIFVADLP